jgi:hypothetical protein
MRTIKIWSLALGAALLAVVFAGASTASAGPTTLCMTSERPCQEGNRHPAGAFEAKSTKATFPNSISTVTCSESVLSGETTAASGDPLLLTFTGWSMKGCSTASGTACTITAVGLPANGSLAWTADISGTLGVSNGGAGEPGWTVKCGFLINCTFTGEPTLAVGGKTITASAEPMNRTGGFCPATTSFTANYTISQPVGTVYVAPATEPATTFCKVNGPLCAAADRYPNGTTIQASSSNVTLKGTTGWPPLSCTSTLTGTVGATPEAGDLPVTVTGWTLNGCKTQSGTACTTTSLNLPYPGSATWIGGSSGALTLDDQPAFQIICGFMINCKITFEAGVEAATYGGAPAQVAISGWKGNSSNGVCLGQAELSATYSVSSPSSLYVAHT